MSDNNYTFQPPPVVKTNNRVNSSETHPANTKGLASVRYTNIILPGQTLPIPGSGTQFYLRTASAVLSIRPSGGIFSDYVQGEGLQCDLDNTFFKLDVKNNNAFNVVFELFIGFQGFIDNKLILANQLYPQIIFPTYPIPSAAAIVDIVDLSGSPFVDINGGKWYALSRIAIIICNTDNGTTLLLQKAGSVISNGPAVAAIQPVTNARFDWSGNFRLNVGGGNINAIVSEIYQAIPQ